MTQESLKRFWNKTKSKGGAILASLIIGCTCFCTPYTSVNAGASGEDVPAPPVGASSDYYLQNGFVGGTFFMSQGKTSGYYDENGFISLALQDNYTDPNKMAVLPEYNVTTYVPDGQAYNRGYGNWLLEKFGDGNNRPYAHRIEGQINIVDETVGSTIYYGITLANRWVNVNALTNYLDGMYVTIGEVKNSAFTRIIQTEIGVRLTCYNESGEDVSYQFNAEQTPNGNVILRKPREIIATKHANGRGYIFVKQLAFLGKITADKVGIYRVELFKGNVVGNNPLTVQQYTADMGKIYTDSFTWDNDIGTIIFSPVKAFLTTEIFPNFTFGTMLLMGLGVIVLGLYLKFALGG